MPPDTIYFCSVSKKHGRGGYMYAIFSPFHHLKQLIILINRVVQRYVITSKQYSKSSCFLSADFPLFIHLFALIRGSKAQYDFFNSFSMDQALFQAYIFNTFVCLIFLIKVSKESIDDLFFVIKLGMKTIQSTFGCVLRFRCNIMRDNKLVECAQ